MKAEASNQKISWFQRENEAGSLDLSPAFQRNPVWTDEEASYLIDTVLYGLPFPEIYLRSRSDSKGRTTHSVVDGQQRIRALLRFSSNDLALDGDEVSAKHKGRSFDDLTTAEKEQFWNYTVVVRDLGNASDAEIRDLFRRLNIHSVIANDQELRNARYKGEFISLMADLADDNWWIDSRIVNPRQVRRMEDIEFVSELFVGLMAGPQNKKDSLETYYETYEREFPDKDKFSKHFRDTKSLIVDVLGTEFIRQWSGKSDFYGLFLAMSEFTDRSLTKAQKKRISERLDRFRQKVDEAKKKDTEEIKEKTIRQYVQAVTRAASDIDRRTTRIDIVRTVISDAIDA